MKKGSHQTLKSRTQMSDSHRGKCLSKEHCESITNGLTGHASWSKGKQFSSEIRKGMSENQFRTWQNDVVRRNKLSDLNKEHWSIPEFKEKTSAKIRGVANDPEHIAWMREEYWDKPSYKKCKSRTTKKLWQDPEYAKNVMQKSIKGSMTKRPNRPEKQIIEILKSLESNIKYVGDGTHWILNTGKNPDFVNEETKKIIEVYGCYWHCCKKHFPNVEDRDSIIEKQHRKDQQRINKFKKLGYSVLIVWEHELKCYKKIILRIKKFIVEGV